MTLSIQTSSGELLEASDFFTYHIVYESGNFHAPAGFLAEIFRDLCNRSLLVLHEALVNEADFAEMLLELSGGNTLGDVFGLSERLRLRGENLFLLGDVGRVRAVDREERRPECRDVQRYVERERLHRLVLLQFWFVELHLHEDADSAALAVDVVADELVTGHFEDFATADRHVLLDRGDRFLNHVVERR